MNTHCKRMSAWVCLAVFSSMLYAGQGERGYIGVMLDPTPLSPLLVKHLGLAPDQGLRIKNINRGTPADRAGLERDDLIIGLNGQKVNDYKGFIDDILQVGAGNAIKLEIIHEGQRKTVELTLAKRTDEFDPKFPPEPDIVQEWRPGKMFHFDADKDGWIEMDQTDVGGPDIKIVKPGIRPPLRTDIRRLFKEYHVFHYSDCDPPCVVSIDGDPHDSDSTVTVESGDRKVSTTVDKIDALPGDLQERARRAVKEARQSARKQTRTRVWNQHSQALEDFMEHPPEEWKDYTDRVLDRVKVFIDKQEWPQSLQSNEKLEKIEEQLKKLSSRMEKLEKELKGKLGNIHIRGDEPDPAPKAPHDDHQDQGGKAKDTADTHNSA